MSLNGQRPLSKAEREERHCACGCNLPHNLAVSLTVLLEKFGETSRRVYWFRTMECRNRFQAKFKEEANG